MIGAWRPKHVEWLCLNKTCTVLHQVGVLFDSVGAIHHVVVFNVTSFRTSASRFCLKLFYVFRLQLLRWDTLTSSLPNLTQVSGLVGIWHISMFRRNVAPASSGFLEFINPWIWSSHVSSKRRDIWKQFYGLPTLESGCTVLSKSQGIWKNSSMAYQPLKLKAWLFRKVRICEKNSSLAHQHLKVKVQLFRNVGMWKQFFCNLPTFENEVAFPSKRRDIWKNSSLTSQPFKLKAVYLRKVGYVTLPSTQRNVPRRREPSSKPRQHQL